MVNGVKDSEIRTAIFQVLEIAKGPRRELRVREVIDNGMGFCICSQLEAIIEGSAIIH